MVLRPQNPNAMPAKQKQTKLTGLLVRREDERPAKRPRLDSPPKVAPRVIPDSEDEPDSDAEDEPDHPRQTDIETAAPDITTDESAIEEYEKAKQATGRYTSSIYVDAFDLALDTVLEEESHLFDDRENKVFRVWRGLDYDAKYLYVRLFLRKTAAWFRVNTLGYDVDVEAAIRMLQLERRLPESTAEEASHPGELEPPKGTTLGETFAFADRSQDHISTLEEASSLLKLDELKALAKDAKVQGKNKTELLVSFRRTSGKQTGLGSTDNRDAHWVKTIMAETGPCVRLSSAALKLFERVHLVFYRSTEWTEKSLKTIILARIARRNFPDYVVSRSANIFPSRAMLLEFEAALRTQFHVDGILENGMKRDLQVVLDVFEDVYPRWRVLLDVEQRKEDSVYLSGEGAYLRRLSPAWVYTRIVHKAAYVFGRFKHHLREHALVSELLDQRLFHVARRGPWYQRKALLEEHYMAALTPAEGRTPEAHRRHWRQVALATCELGLQDHLTHLVHHYDLQKRVVKLERRLKIAKRLQHSFSHVRLAAPVEVAVEGVRVERAGDPFSSSTSPRLGKTVWLDPSSGSPCSVEQMALSHYQQQGWRGAHTESSILTTLFGLLFHSVLFTYVPHVFQTPYQSAPLDLASDGFYAARASLVHARLAEIENGDAVRIARETWEREAERRTAVVGVDWRWQWEDVEEVLRAFGGEGLSAVCRVLAQEYGVRRGGVPDLFLWRTGEVEANAKAKAETNVEAKGDVEAKADGEAKAKSPAIGSPNPQNHNHGEVLFVEVKSANDRLSDSQRLWIHVLTGAGVRVELANAVASEVRVVSGDSSLR
ncbi:hypothetical protein IWZ00DRAFT_494113 [Phyllosticta capitalensis]